MFREMRLADNKISAEEAKKILEHGTNGVLAVHGDDGYPYAVPVSYAYCDDKIYFHGTSEISHKIDSIKRDPKVSFCVIGQDHIISEAFNTLYKSTIVFGKARVLSDEKQFEQGIMAILNKYSGEHLDAGKDYINASKGQFCVVEIQVEHMTGKLGS